MRQFVRDFITEAIEQLPMADPIVEIGSRPASGQEEMADLRGLLSGHDFLGTDIQEGPGVDRVEDIHALTFDDNSIGTVIALDTLEHVADPIRGLQQIHRVLAPGGVVVITSHMFMPIHAHPWDYWRFTPEAFSLLLAPFESQLVLANGWELMPDTVIGIGVKGPKPDLRRELFPRTVAQIDSWGAGLPVDLGPIRMNTKQAWRIAFDATKTSVGRRLGRSKP